MAEEEDRQEVTEVPEEARAMTQQEQLVNRFAAQQL